MNMDNPVVDDTLLTTSSNTTTTNSSSLQLQCRQVPTFTTYPTGSTTTSSGNLTIRPAAAAVFASGLPLLISSNSSSSNQKNNHNNFSTNSIDDWLGQQLFEAATSTTSSSNSNYDGCANNDVVSNMKNHCTKRTSFGSGSSSTSQSVATTSIKRRICNVQGCSRVVKSQGVCQRHGAKTRLCKIQGCNKQSQGSYGGMCKYHYKSQAFSPQDDHLRSCYDLLHKQQNEHQKLVEQSTSSQRKISGSKGDDHPSVQAAAAAITTTVKCNMKTDVESVYDTVIPSTISWTYRSSTRMPLASYLEQGHSKDLPAGWHRNLERVAQQLIPLYDMNLPFETWEVDLIWTEIGLLTGLSDASFVHLAHAWAREPGFHFSFARTVCETRSSRKQKKILLAGSSEQEEQKQDQQKKIQHFQQQQQQHSAFADSSLRNHTTTPKAQSSSAPFFVFGRDDHSTNDIPFGFGGGFASVQCQQAAGMHKKMKQTDDTQESLELSYMAFQNDF